MRNEILIAGFSTAVVSAFAEHINKSYNMRVIGAADLESSIERLQEGNTGILIIGELPGKDRTALKQEVLLRHPGVRILESPGSPESLLEEVKHLIS